MKVASDAHKALLATGQFVSADCFTITLVDGTNLLYTNAPMDVTVVPLTGGEPVTYSAQSVLIDGLRYTASIGVTVDEQDIKISATPAQLVHGIPFLTAMRFGLFDGARIHRDQFHAPEWNGAATAFVGGVPMFYGRVSTIDSIGVQDASLKVKSDLILLDRQMPRNLYQPSCMNTLYDVMCKVDRPSNTVAGTVGNGPSPSVIPWSSGDASFNLGVVAFTSGPNTGQRRSIRMATPSALVLAYPLNIAPDAGDTFTATRGCSKVYEDAANGCAFFNNQANFRGFKDMPVPESAY